MLPYLALALYIISLITSLILMLTAKRKGAVTGVSMPLRFKAAAFVHVLFLILFILVYTNIINRTHASLLLNLSFLFYFCSGTALCGWAIRTKVGLLMKIYFALFDASVILFVLMPFNFSLFLLSGNWNGLKENKFLLNDHYYITEQGTVMKESKSPIYRVVKRNGMFNQTVQYNLSFGGVLDSIHVMNVINDKSASFRAYIKNADKSNTVDSVDIDVKLQRESKDEIKRDI